MHRIDSRAVCAALLLSFALAACDGGGTAASAAPSADSQQTPGSGTNANAESNPPGPPVMHWAPSPGASGAH